MVGLLEVLLATNGSTAVFGDLVVDAASALVEADFRVACQCDVGKYGKDEGHGRQRNHSEAFDCEHLETLSRRASEGARQVSGPL